MTESKSTYTRLLDNGKHEFGIVQYGCPRTKDKLVSVGIEDTFEDADKARAAIAKATA